MVYIRTFVLLWESNIVITYGNELGLSPESQSWQLIAPVVYATLVLAIGFAVWFFYRSCRIVVHWAKTNGFRVMSIKIPLNPGPLWCHTAWPKYQMIYYATILTPYNELKSAWVLCGNNWWGILSNHVVTEWDDRPDSRRGIRMPFVSNKRSTSTQLS